MLGEIMAYLQRPSTAHLNDAKGTVSSPSHRGLKRSETILDLLDWYRVPQRVRPRSSPPHDEQGALQDRFEQTQSCNQAPSMTAPVDCERSISPRAERCLGAHLRCAGGSSKVSMSGQRSTTWMGPSRGLIDQGESLMSEVQCTKEGGDPCLRRLIRPWPQRLIVHVHGRSKFIQRGGWTAGAYRGQVLRRSPSRSSSCMRPPTFRTHRATSASRPSIPFLRFERLSIITCVLQRDEQFAQGDWSTLLPSNASFEEATQFRIRLSGGDSGCEDLRRFIESLSPIPSLLKNSCSWSSTMERSSTSSA